MYKVFKSTAGLLLSLVCLSGIQAQEVIIPLYNNPMAASGHLSQRGLKKSAEFIMLELPFFDDFSNSAGSPNMEFWSDDFAFVNNNFSVDPVSNGVATLDALDSDGSLYPTAVLSPNTFIADSLTSHPINLNYPVSDSIYLSFLFQPGGLCDIPEEDDSLMVDFFAQDSGMWVNVWSIPGSDVHPFQHAMIPVKEERFLVEGFRFRFRNRASLPRNNDYLDMRSNVDYWHIDYVRLDHNRFAADTVLRDVAFNTPLTSILKDLSSLPWSHFKPAYNTVLNPYTSGRYRNNDSITRNVTRSLTIYEPAYNEVHTPGVPTAQDLPGMTDTVVNFGFIYPFNFNRGDSALIRFEAALRTDEFDPKVNDTVVHDQLFKDYYAYDDGTPEAGYGLRGSGTAAGVVAIKYNAYQADLLGGVYISFNQVYDSINLDYYFNLMVWDDDEGKPGVAIWDDKTDFKPIYPSSYPGFVKYEFSEPVPVDGPFYVGWKQYNQYLLNVGLDKNNNPSPSVMYYNIQGIWRSSSAPGVIMFRPYLYDETTGLEQASHPSTAMQLFPNPATDRIYFELPDPGETSGTRIEIYDAAGRLVRQVTIDSNSMDVSGLARGMYHVRILSGSNIYHSKLLINP